MSRQFQRVGGARVGRSVFNLSYEKKLTCDMGKLIPIMCDEVVPGDVFSIGNELVIRMQPLVAPILHEINAYIHYFYVPYRLLWDDWEDFITGGVDGEQAPSIPTWATGTNGVGTLWDHLGFPVGVAPGSGSAPLDFPRRAYNFIFDEYYRDETLVASKADLTNVNLLNRAWEKDYFTSALPWQQRGTAPALPISGTTSAVFDNSAFILNSVGNPLLFSATIDNEDVAHIGTARERDNALGFLDQNSVDLSTASTFDIADLRLAFQIQRWLERNARAGARYTEFLKSHFGVSPRDDRLDRPEYIGGSKSPVIISEVLQTSETATSPQGNLAGHGITVDKKFIGKKRVEEYGLIMGIMSIMPRSVYTQGIDRQWLRRTKYDFFFPEFANLSEQAINTGEIYATNSDSENNTVFGYQGRYDEMRVKKNLVAGQMNPTGNLNYWHLGREFSSAPLLNESFIECIPRKDIFAVPSEDGFIVNIGNVIKAVRPMPIMANPGLIDHV